ncbi:MAG: Flp pilus assembly complex ATPase component TadA [Candidatus Omnitrophica bacterium]|nr:Flp pilus assembly complex ATPase component TadA [Candidatus Omnitrophota bacterium]
MAKTVKDTILDELVGSGKFPPKVLEEAKQLHLREKIPFEKALIKKGLITEEDWLLMLVSELGIPFVNLARYKLTPYLQEIIPENIARQYKIVPLVDTQFSVTIATADPLNVYALDDLKNITGKRIDVVLNTESEIIKKIDNFYGDPTKRDVPEFKAQDAAFEEFELVSQKEEDDANSGGEAVDESEKAPIIRMVNLILKEALRQRASDIHIEPMEECVRVRYRIDGVLRDVLTIPKKNQNAMATRIKIMSRLDITVNQAPQDGRFKLTLKEKSVDFRVSILPATFGPKVVMRILDRSKLAVGVDGLGLTPKALQLIKDGIKKPFGMMLVTGPTGSGKSTTLYSIVNELNTVERNIITVEDPVEYLLEGLTQIQAMPEIGLTFAEGLRSILRQSPDVVMVGEIRDGETADIAIKASLTGQLVLSTLHTNDAAGALTRLVDMGVEPFLVASSLVLVTAQRLCRRICPHCKAEIKIDPDVLKRLGDIVPKDSIFYQGKGCEQCKNTGYTGRLCITEVLDIDDEIRMMLLQGKTSDEIKKYSREKKGMATLYQDAMAKCLQGITSLEEVFRITSSD